MPKPIFEPKSGSTKRIVSFLIGKEIKPSLGESFHTFHHGIPNDPMIIIPPKTGTQNGQIDNEHGRKKKT